MPKLIALATAAGVVAGGFWLGERIGLPSANDLVKSAQEKAVTIDVWPSIAAAVAGTDELPEGRRLIEIYAKVRRIDELGEANQKFRAEVNTARRVAAALSDTHGAATKSCAVVERQPSDTPVIFEERSKEIAEALKQIDTWMLGVVELARKARPAEAGTAMLHHGDFDVARVELEQTLGGMRSLLATFPRLAEACNFTIPPLRAEISE